MNKRNFALLAISNALASIGTGISMIAIPWIIATSADSNQGTLFILASVINLLLFFIVPFVGPLIDQKNRKYLMITIRVIFICIVAVSVFIPGSFKGIPVTVLIYYFTGSLFYVVNIPTRTAFVKDLFPPSQYARINGFLESENQIAAVVTGIVAVFLVETVGINSLALINIGFYVIAIGLLSLIHYNYQPEERIEARILSSLVEGLAIARCKYTQFYIVSILSVPYVIVIGFTIFHPAALATFKGATSKTYALVETLFGIGAIISGIVTPWIIQKFTNRDHLQRYLLLLFAIVCMMHAIFVNQFAYIFLAFFLGLLNSSIRIFRTTLQMQLFTHSEMGRIGTLLQSWILALRVLLLSCLAFLSGVVGISILASVLFGIAFLAFAGLFISEKIICKES